MNSLGLAIKLAAEVHEGQVDKAGEDYILHCLAVMHMVESHGKEAMIVGVLHDSLEDFKGTTLEKSGFVHTLETNFSGSIMIALWALTHSPDESYSDYVERVATNYLARIVKIADLTHNMDPRRIPAAQIIDKDFQRWDKYRKALIRLQRQ